MILSPFRYVVGTYIVNNNRVLLLWHQDRRLWVPPGGRLELTQGETPHEAALRHVLEECGLTVDLTSTTDGVADEFATPLPTPAAVQELTPRGGDRLLDFVYFGTASGGSPTLNFREARAYHWFTLEDLTRFPVVGHVRHHARTALQQLGVDEALERKGTEDGSARTH